MSSAHEPGKTAGGGTSCASQQPAGRPNGVPRHPLHVAEGAHRQLQAAEKRWMGKTMLLRGGAAVFFRLRILRADSQNKQSQIY